MSGRFDYVKYDERAMFKQTTLKTQFQELERLVDELLPKGRAQSLVHTHLEEAYMWVGKAIRDEQLMRENVNQGGPRE